MNLVSMSISIFFRFAVCAAAFAVVVLPAFAKPVLPGYLTDPSVMKGAVENEKGYQPPEQLKYPYISTYYDNTNNRYCQFFLRQNVILLLHFSVEERSGAEMW